MTTNSMEDARRISEHGFGGSWTEKKLRVVRGYLSFFSHVLGPTNFETWYIDAFAGDGGRVSPVAVGGLIEAHEEEQLDGSARIALETDPGFGNYVLIESNRNRARRLETLRSEYPNRNIAIIRQDANEALQEMFAKAQWRRGSRRAVLFLDPYGLNVRWETLQAAAATRAVDVWYFFNLEGVVRQLSERGSAIDEDKRACITALFGTDGWLRAFYQVAQGSLLDRMEPSEMRTADRTTVSNWATQRFRDAFSHVSEPIPIHVPARGHSFSLYCMSNSASGPAIAAIRRGVELARKDARDWSRPPPAFRRRSGP